MLGCFQPRFKPVFKPANYETRLEGLRTLLAGPFVQSTRSNDFMHNVL